jgi:hypothetical protein
MIKDDIYDIITYLMSRELFDRDYDRYLFFYHEYDNLPEVPLCISGYKTMCIPDITQRHYFTDTKLKTRGYIKWEARNVEMSVRKKTLKSNEQGVMTTIEENVIVTVRVPVLVIVINKSVSEYLCAIKKETLISTRFTQLYFVHITDGMNENNIFVRKLSYYDYKSDFIAYFKEHYAATEKQNWIDTFFHPSKNTIWTKLKTISFDPENICKYGQYPQASYCLYGPPGTGKSTIVYRMAKALGRGIISINISGVKTTLELRRLLNGMQLKPAPLHSNDTLRAYAIVDTDPNQCIFVFDEFDKAIMALKARSDLKAKKEKDIIKRFKLINKRMKNKKWIYSDSESESEPRSDGTTAKISCLKPGEKEPNIDDEVSSAIDDLIQVDDDLLTVDSLLDIVQGACANPGSIIFAITNNYAKISAICPRLFRDGRFKPIHFGYPLRQTINEITMYYFNRSIMEKEYDYIPDIVRISTARITHLAVDLKHMYSTENEQFEKFIEHLRYDLNNYTLSEKFKEYEQCTDTDLSSQGSTNRV